MAESKRRRSARPRATGRGATVEELIESFFARTKAAGDEFGRHSVRIQVVGAESGIWSMEPEGGVPRLTRGKGRREPTIEVIIEADALRSVLEGGREGREAFLAGGIRVRGDIGAIQLMSEAAGTHASAAHRVEQRREK